MKREKKFYGVLTIENGSAFVDRYSESERQAIARVGLERTYGAQRKITYFVKRKEAYKFAEQYLNDQITFTKHCLEMLKGKFK